MKKWFLALALSLFLVVALIPAKSDATEAARWLETGEWDTFCNLINTSTTTDDTVTITFYGTAITPILVAPTTIGSTVATIVGSGGMWQVQAEDVVGTSSTWEGGSLIILGEAAGTKGACFNFNTSSSAGFGYAVP